MNILMALSQLEVTGAEVYATTVGNELERREHNVIYVSDTLTKPHTGLFYSLRFNKRSILRRFWHVSYLIYLIKKHDIQLVHAHSRASSWSCHLACKLTGTPMVTLCMAGSLSMLLVRSFMPWAIKHFQFVKQFKTSYTMILMCLWIKW